MPLLGLLAAAATPTEHALGVSDGQALARRAAEPGIGRYTADNQPGQGSSEGAPTMDDTAQEGASSTKKKSKTKKAKQEAQAGAVEMTGSSAGREGTGSQGTSHYQGGSLAVGYPVGGGGPVAATEKINKPIKTGRITADFLKGPPAGPDEHRREGALGPGRHLCTSASP